MKIRKIEAKAVYREKKVAAYARVSTHKEEQSESFETQVRYYQQVIKSNPDWKYVKVYADQGFSGVNAQKRPGFMEMIADAEKRKFDIILVRSISRFARNVKEAQEYCQILKAYGIEVRFEREMISSLDTSAEAAFNILAAAAQEESRSISEKTKWSYKEHARQGVRHLGNNRVLGYDEVDGELTPNEDAWIVKFIFEEYARGQTNVQIADTLRQREITGIRDAEIKPAHIEYILQNEIYLGDRRIQKAAHTNYLTHRPDWSQPFDSYYVKDTHEAIVTTELWKKVQMRWEKEQRLKKMGVQKHKNSNPLYGKVYCGWCGSPMKRKVTILSEGKVFIWKCSDRLKGKKGNGCLADYIKESDLMAEIAAQLNIPISEVDTRLNSIERIIVKGSDVQVTYNAA